MFLFCVFPPPGEAANRHQQRQAAVGDHAGPPATEDEQAGSHDESPRRPVRQTPGLGVQHGLPDTWLSLPGLRRGGHRLPGQVRTQTDRLHLGWAIHFSMGPHF